MPVILRLVAPAAIDLVGAVEADQPSAVRAMERQGIVEAVRLARRRRNPCHDEPNPVAARRIHDQNLTVQVEQRVQAGIPLRHGLKGYQFSIRSEEHTSELQSLMRISYAVFCLKKKKQNKPEH